jgi:hypothetical protein
MSELENNTQQKTQKNEKQQSKYKRKSKKKTNIKTNQSTAAISRWHIYFTLSIHVLRKMKIVAK